MKSKAKGTIVSPRKQLVKSLQTEGIQRKPLQVCIKILSAPRKGSRSIPGVETPSVPRKKRKYVSHSLPTVLCYKQHSLGSWSPPSAACAGHMSMGALTVMVRGLTMLSPACMVTDFRALGWVIYITRNSLIFVSSNNSPIYLFLVHSTRCQVELSVRFENWQSCSPDLNLKSTSMFLSHCHF